MWIVLFTTRTELTSHKYTMVPAESRTGLEEAGRGLWVGRRSAISVGEDWWRKERNRRRKKCRKVKERREEKGQVKVKIKEMQKIKAEIFRFQSCWLQHYSAITFFVSSVFSLCSVLPLTFRRASSMSGRLPGPFFFFSLARIEDSLSGKGGISSKTVACWGPERARRHWEALERHLLNLLMVCLSHFTALQLSSHITQ